MSDGMEPFGASAHPLDVDLVAFADGGTDEVTTDRIADHVRRCSSCAAAIANLAEPLALEPERHDVLIPDAASDLFTAQDAHDPRPHELWHLSWASSALLAVVRTVSEGGADVVPVTTTGPEGDDSPHVEDALSPLGLALYPWPELARAVPLGVFAHFAGTLDDAAFLVVSGEPATRSTTEAVLLRVELATAMDDLAAASWVPAADADVLSLRTLMEELSLRPSDLAEATGIEPATITQLVRGTREMTVADAELLAPILGVSAADMVRPLGLPDALVCALERPRHRAALVSLAAREEVSEAAIRYVAASQVFAMAARTTPGQRDVDAWSELLEHFLDE